MTTTPPRVLTLVQGPAVEPLTLADVKLFLRIDGSAEDALLIDLIGTARHVAEQWLRRSLLRQRWKLTQRYVGAPITLPLGPVREVMSVTTQALGQSIELDEAQYGFAGETAQVHLLNPGNCERVKIVFEAGFDDASDLPKTIRHGLLQLIAYLHTRRGESEAVMPPAVKALWAQEREMML